MSKKREKNKTKEIVKKTAKGAYIVTMIGVTLFGIMILAVLIFIGVRLWQWLAPLLANV